MSGTAAGGPVDFAYLESFAAGDMPLVREVLEMFCEQAAGWAQRLDARAADWRDVVHNIKGSSRGVGANVLGDACAMAEAGGGEGVADVRRALDEAVAAMRAYLSN